MAKDIKKVDLTKKNLITITKGDGYMSINVRGHNEDPRTCAGISAIMQTAELGLQALANSVNGVIIIEETIS